MSSSETRYAPSTRTGMAATTTTTISATSATSTKPRPYSPDHHAWQAFLANPDTITWVKAVIAKRLGLPQHRPLSFDESHLEDRTSEVLLALVEATGFRLGRGSVQAYAIGILQQTMISSLRHRQAQVRDQRRDRRLDPGHDSEESSLLKHLPWEHDRYTAEQEVRRAISEAVQTAVNASTPEARAWAQTYLQIAYEDADKERRPDTIRQVERRLGGTRTACDRARATLRKTLDDLCPVSRP